MQALSSYNPDKHSLIKPALRALEMKYSARGLTAGSYDSAKGVFARFVWPDWPESVSNEIASKVDAFHRANPELRRIEKGTSDWTAIFRWEGDADSAAVIASRFRKHFRGRVLWVESERDERGRIEARCSVEGVGEIPLRLFWRDSFAGPVPDLTDADHSAFQSCVQEVFHWAHQGIQSILEALNEKLQGVYGERFRGLYVFGSYAKPDAGIELPADSDLDVALILSDFEDPHQEFERFGQVTSDLTLEHGLVVSVVPLREADYIEGRTSSIRAVSEVAIQVR